MMTSIAAAVVAMARTFHFVARTDRMHLQLRVWRACIHNRKIVIYYSCGSFRAVVPEESV